jgi:hypothetical protein
LTLEVQLEGLKKGHAMATMARPRLEAATSSLDRAELLSLIEEEARLLGLSAETAIAQVKHGKPERGYIWDDLSLLVTLLTE